MGSLDIDDNLSELPAIERVKRPGKIGKPVAGIDYRLHPRLIDARTSRSSA